MGVCVEGGAICFLQQIQWGNFSPFASTVAVPASLDYLWGLLWAELGAPPAKFLCGSFNPQYLRYVCIWRQGL